MFGILIGYGLIFVFLGVGGFDILADFVGYFLVYRCLDRLCYKSDSFNKARPLALVMTVLTFVAAFAPFLVGDEISNLIKTVAVISSLLFFFLIVKGMKELEEVEAKDFKSGKLKKSWIFFTISQLICTFVPVSESGALRFILTVGSVGAVISSLAILVFLYQAKVTYDYVAEPEKEKAKRQKKLSRKERKQMNK